MNYQNGKIYKIESNLGEKIYIGSTTKDYLSQRMTAHRNRYRCWKNGKEQGQTRSFELFDEYGLDNCNIVLIEVYPCNSKDELHAREGYYIKSMKCCNKVVPGRTDSEYIQDNKQSILEYQAKYRSLNKEKNIKYGHEYYATNKDKINAYLEKNKEVIKIKRKEYREANKEIITEKQRTHRELNKEKINERNRELYKQNYPERSERILLKNKKYRDSNADKIKEQRSQLFVCVCGSECQNANRLRHLKTPKHIRFVNEQSSSL